MSQTQAARPAESDVTSAQAPRVPRSVRLAGLNAKLVDLAERAKAVDLVVSPNLLEPVSNLVSPAELTRRERHAVGIENAVAGRERRAANPTKPQGTGQRRNTWSGGNGAGAESRRSKGKGHGKRRVTGAAYVPKARKSAPGDPDKAFITPSSTSPRPAKPAKPAESEPQRGTRKGRDNQSGQPNGNK